MDPYVGYLHTERPGRVSLALDMIEELRAVLADRFVLTLVNKKIVSGKNFTQKENGAVIMDDELRRRLLTEWQNKKKEETNAGKTRLRKVAKQCTNYGRRVQNSVFECIVDNAQCVELKAILSDIIDKNLDSLRFYYLGNNYQTKIEHIGIERGISVDQVLFL